MDSNVTCLLFIIQYLLFIIALLSFTTNLFVIIYHKLSGIKPINLLVGGLTLFAAQGCKAPKQASQQAEHPNIIYVFPDQYRNQAMGFWRQDGFGIK